MKRAALTTSPSGKGAYLPISIATAPLPISPFPRTYHFFLGQRRLLLVKAETFEHFGGGSGGGGSKAHLGGCGSRSSGRSLGFSVEFGVELIGWKGGEEEGI